MSMVDKFAEQRLQDKQSLYREKEVFSLSEMIYKETNKDDEDVLDSEYIVDTNRFQVN